jgi:hypothetical protein
MYTTLFFSLITWLISAQVPVIKVDLEVDANRKISEVNEPGYTSWRVTSAPASKTIEGVTFSFNFGTLEDCWYKASVMPPYYARLVGDGFKTSLIILSISGLQTGSHSLTTIHNEVDNPDNNVFSPIDIYLNNELVFDNLISSVRVLNNDEGQTAFMEFDVETGDTVNILFASDPRPESTTNLIPINGFYLNKSNPKKMARLPYPSDKEEHVDIDNDTLEFQWSGPDSTVSYNFYFGKNKTGVLLANTDSSQFVANLTDTFYLRTGFYSMDSYYWRIDPIHSNGDTTKGDVWYFKKRIPAFPEAEGYGGYAIGGRGGKVVYVTNLKDDNNPGSFRYAVENVTGPRTILFAVSGLITLTDRIFMNDDYITVAGQSAPGKGICFRWAPIGVTGDNLIVQNIRMRLGFGITYDGMGLTGANHSIIDHCSISWTIDESFSSRGAEHITLQRTLISEALNKAEHDKYGSGSEHGFAGSVGGDIGSLHHNLLAHCNGRNWSLAGGLDGDGYYAGRMDIFNMVVYNWGYRATDGGAHEVNFVNNYYKKGPSTIQNTILRAQLEGVGKGSQSYYYAGNIVENTNGILACDGTDNTCSRTYELSGGQILDWEVWVDKPFYPSLATIHPAKEAYKLVLSDVGCTQPVFDEHDTRIIKETINGSYTYKGSLTGKAGFPDREWDVGSWEAYPGYLRSTDWDSDLDGLPNWWEKALGLDTNSVTGDFTESNADADSNGYTKLEEYLHWMDKPHYFMHEEDSIQINLAMYTKGFTNNPVHEILDVVNGEADLLEDTTIVSFKPLSEGLAELEFKVSDAEGTSMIRKIGIFKGAMASDSMFTYTYQLGREDTKYEYSIVTVDSVNTVYTPQSSREQNILGTPEIWIYPNPVNDNLFIDLNANSITTIEIGILDLTGKLLVHKELYTNQSRNTIDLDISNLKSGMYMISLIHNGYIKTATFIKK